MKLMEILVNLPIEELQQIAYKTGSSGFYHSKADLIRSIFEHLNDHVFVNSLLRKLSPQNKELLKLLMIYESDHVNTVNNESSRNDPLRQYEKDDHFKILRDTGLIYVINGRCLIPEELSARIMECLQSILFEDFVVTLSSDVNVSSNGLMLYQDIYHFLAFLSKNEIRLTQKDLIYSRTLQRLQKLMLTFENHADQNTTIDASQGQTPFFTCILDFCLTTGLITKQGTKLLLSEQAEDWINASLTEQVMSVFNYFQQQLENRFEQLKQILALLHNIEYGSWIDSSQFFRKITLMAPSTNQENLDLSDLSKSFLEPLHMMGFIETSQTEGNVSIFRVSPLGQAIMSEDRKPLSNNNWETVVIQPNFELLVPQDLPFSLRWSLEAIADMVSVGKMMTYSLSKESLINGMKKGLSVDTILSVLRKLSGKQIPQNIEQTIMDWSEVYGQVQFTKGVLVHCKKPEIAKIILSIPGLENLIVKRITPIDLLIEFDDVETVRALLETNEIIPVPGIKELRTLFSDLSDPPENRE